MSHICSICNSGFSTKQGLIRHNDRKYKCSSLELPKLDMLETDFGCKYCGKSYSSKQSLSNHIHKFCKLSPYVIKKNTTTNTISSNTQNCSSTISINGTNNTIKNSLNTIINIFIDGIEFKDDELDMLKSMSKDNVKKLLGKLKKLQRPFGKEQIKDIDEDGFIQLFENTPLTAFSKFITLMHKDPQNKNITIINKHHPYITFIKDDLKFNDPQTTPEDKEKELSKITNKYITQFFKYYDKYKPLLSDIDIDKYTELKDIIDGTIYSEKSYIRYARTKDIEYNFDEKIDDNIYILDDKLDDNDFETLDEYHEYCDKYESFQIKRDYYKDKFSCYQQRVEKYKTEPAKIVRGFLLNYSPKHTPIMKKHQSIMHEIETKTDSIPLKK